MPLSAGTRLGPYEVIAPLGVGGMGEIYRARDTRLERTVAIKVLPAMLAGDPEFRARFDREAKSISALNHPHICTLYDVGRIRAEGDAARRSRCTRTGSTRSGRGPEGSKTDEGVPQSPPCRRRSGPVVPR